MLDFLFQGNQASQASLIRMVPVGLGSQLADIPVAVLLGNRPGKTLLVTAGTDGDEYAGMEAAYTLIERFRDGNFAGKLIVIPVLNVPGFQNECSQNPIDDRFPKMVFPGRIDGSATERLIHWLVSAYAYHADAWLDLHGGAITEGVLPFLWMFESGVDETDALAKAFLRASGAETVVFERVGAMSKAGVLARKGCAYVIAESGDRGCRDASDVDRHVSWAATLMGTMGMVSSEIETPPVSQNVLRRAAIVGVPFEGIWYPADLSGGTVEKGAMLGACVRLDGLDARELMAPVSGTVLWWKMTMAMRKGDVLVAIGTP